MKKTPPRMPRTMAATEQVVAALVAHHESQGEAAVAEFVDALRIMARTADVVGSTDTALLYARFAQFAAAVWEDLEPLLNGQTS